MTIRLSLLAMLLLAACSEPRPAADAASSDTRTAPSADASRTGPAARPDADLPDFGDPRAFVTLDPPRWADVESPVQGDRLARLRALGIEPLRTDSTGPREPPDPEVAGDYDPDGERAIDYHFIDFSGDGVDDVVYDGLWFVRNDEGEVGAMEGTHVKLYQVMDGRAVEVMDHHGSIQRIWKGRAGQPVSFRTYHPGCCADEEWTIAYFRPVVRGDTVRFHPYHHVLGRAEMRLPTRFLSAPRRFSVTRDGYLLRASPEVRDTGDTWPDWAGRGNALAEYGRGARGTAIAEQADATGRVWWFVRMDGRTPPRDAQNDVPWDGDHPLPADRLGWMSSRFLQAEP